MSKAPEPEEAGKKEGVETKSFRTPSSLWKTIRHEAIDKNLDISEATIVFLSAGVAMLKGETDATKIFWESLRKYLGKRRKGEDAGKLGFAEAVKKALMDFEKVEK